MASAPRKAAPATHGHSKVSLVIGRRFRLPGVPEGAEAAVAALREARPDLVHEEIGTVWLGLRHPERAEATEAEIAAAVAAVADGVPAELLWHPELLALAVGRVETDR